MAKSIVYGKRIICYTDCSDYTDYQGIGHDPLYKRYDSVYSVVKNLIDSDYQHFLAQPMYSESEDVIYWYVDNWYEEPKRFVNLSDEDRAKYEIIKSKTIQKYEEGLKKATNESLQILNGALKYIDENAIYCYDNKVFLVAWGMTPDMAKHKLNGTIIHDYVYREHVNVQFDCGAYGELMDKHMENIALPKDKVLTVEDLPTVKANEGYVFDSWSPNPIGFKLEKDVKFLAQYSKQVDSENDYVEVRFVSTNEGRIEGTTSLKVKKGSTLDIDQIPNVQSINGFRFTGWSPDIDNPIYEDTVFKAIYVYDFCECKFDAGDHGEINENAIVSKAVGSNLTDTDIPIVKVDKGYKFVGWDSDPLSASISDNIVFHAQYEQRLPWYKRLWLFLTGRGCLKWLLWILGIILFLILFSLLMRSCTSCSGRNKVTPVESITTPDGKTIDNNDNKDAGSIVGDDGNLPDGESNIVAPIVGGDGTLPPIIENPGAPSIIANRLNLYFEDENVDLNQFVKDFKQVYPDDDYRIIGFDDNVKMIQIEVPEERRDYVRESINSKLSTYQFFVVDESIFQISGDYQANATSHGWHLSAIHLEQGWRITKGSKDVVVAIVDDGIDYQHPLFKGKVVRPYNVFTKDNHLSVGEGHGTHVAGLAVGLSTYWNKGVSGVAPNCKLMPIQVFDNKICTFSSITSGIMYAIHNDADVVNISIGPSFEGLNVLPIESQKELARTQFKNEEKVWRKIIKIANDNNCVLVFAVGNDQVLASLPPENRTNKTINVAAVDDNYSMASFSNFGEGTSVTAPGVGINSAFPKNDFKVLDGTSMAAPIVSGTVALMKSINANITVTQVLNVLQRTGRRINGYHSPMILVDKALQAVVDGDFSTPEISDNGNGNDGSNNGGGSGSDSGSGGSGDGSNSGGDGGSGNPNEGGDNGDNGAEGGNENSDEDTPNEDENNATDYSKIRKLIEEYKQKIIELEKQLPENRK